jgi:hypothetical protein
MPPSSVNLHHHKVRSLGLGHMFEKQVHHLGIGRGQNERGHFAHGFRYSRIDVGVLSYDVMWPLRSHARRSPSTSGDADARRRDLHLRPSLALVLGHEDCVWEVALEPPAQSFFKSSLLFWIGFGMTGARHELAPAMPIQQAIDTCAMHRMLDLCFKGALYVFRRGNFSLCRPREKGLEKAAFLFHAHVFMTASTLAWRFDGGKSPLDYSGK